MVRIRGQPDLPAGLIGRLTYGSSTSYFLSMKNAYTAEPSRNLTSTR